MNKNVLAAYYIKILCIAQLSVAVYSNAAEPMELKPSSTPDVHQAAGAMTPEQCERFKRLVHRHEFVASKVLTGHEIAITCLSCSPNGTQLASGSYDDTVRLWDTKTGEVQVLAGHEGLVFCLSYSPDGNQLASGSDDKTVRLWDPKIGRLFQVLTGHEGSVYCLGYSPDGTQLVSGSFDRTVRLWNTKTGRLFQVLAGHEGSVLCLSYSPDGTQLASGLDDETVRLWDLSGSDEESFKKFCSSLSPEGIALLDRLSKNKEHIFILTAPEEIIWNTLLGSIRASIQENVKILSADWQCSICLEGAAADPVQEIKCGHIFHELCIKRWTDQGGTLCPMCRAPIAQ
jgi:uncharacterized protein (DUF2147 family)